MHISLSYSGGLADNNVIDMYDAARGLAGFHRSLALTTHLVLHGEIITQATALRDAQIITTTPEAGSWKVTAIILGGLWTVASAPKDTVAGHLLFSVYDYAVKETLGFHPTFEKSLGVQYEDYLKSKKITQEKVDSLIEKTETSVADMHRPMVGSGSALKAEITGVDNAGVISQIGPELNSVTYEYMSTTITDENPVVLIGSVSSFNINTNKGRIFLHDEQRPVPFEIANEARSTASIVLLASSLRANALNRSGRVGQVRLLARRLTSTTGRVKALLVYSVAESNALHTNKQEMNV